MLTLLIDTSTERGIVAIADGLDLLFTQELPRGALSSSHLISAIQTGFQRLKKSPHDLKRVGVGVGPGMFTGIRVGVATAKGISFGCGIPLIGFCSLQGFTSEAQGIFASVIDARVGGVYLLLQERKGDKISLIGSPTLSSLEELPLKLQGCSTIVGPSFQRLALPEAIEMSPDVAHLAKLVENSPPDAPFELLYLRDSL